MKVLALLAEGFEDLEALGTIALLRRADIDVSLCSVENKDKVCGKYGIRVDVDSKISDVSMTDVDVLFLPGGMPGVTNLYNNEYVRNVVTHFIKEEKLLCAICAAPAIPGLLGLLKDKKVTCYPGFEKHCTGAFYTDCSVILDNHLITGRAAGSVYEFAKAIITRIKGEEKANQVMTDICVNRN